MVSEESIRRRSYAIWEREGRPEGKSLEHWLKAKAELGVEQPKRMTRAFEYYATLYRVEQLQGAVLPKPRISAPPQVTLAGRIQRDNHPVAA
jgi:hypothetical protein